jgi:3'-5' exoribonuclease
MECKLIPGQKIDHTFILRKKELRTKRDSQEFYLSIELGNADGRINGTVWDNVRQWYDKLEIGKPVHITANVIDWKNKAHLSVTRIKPITNDRNIDPSDYIPRAAIDVDLVFENILGIIETIENHHLRKLLLKIFTQPALKKSFCNSPAGKLWHHNVSGGLVEHTWSVLSIVLDIAKFYSNLDKDLLIAGALLHDIGKIKEYETRGFIDYSLQGRLEGHIAIGYHLVAQRIDEYTNFPNTLRTKLLHLILSHQGSREQGSPVVPMMREAFLLYYADEIDSKLNAFDRIEKRDHDTENDFSRYITLMDRFLYLG